MRHCFALLIFITPLLNAQEGPQVAQQAIKDPSLTSLLADVGQVTLSSTEKGTDVRAEIGIVRPGKSAATDWLVSIGAQASIKDKDEVELTSLSGLTTGTAADLRITRINYGKHYDPGKITLTCHAFNASRIRTAPLAAIEPCTDAAITAAIAIRPAGTQGALLTAYAQHIAAGATTTCEAYNKANAGPPIADTATACTTEATAKALLDQATIPTKDCVDAAPACWAATLADNIRKERNAFCERLHETITAVLKQANDDAIRAAINTLPVDEKERLTSLYADSIAAGAIATCDAYNKAGAGPRIADLPVACADEPSTRALLAQATTKPKDCNLTTAPDCWNAALDENIAKQQNAFREQLNTDADLWKLLRITGDDTTCNLAELKARGNKDATITWYEQGIKDIGLAPSYFGVSAKMNSAAFTYATGTILDDKKITQEKKQGLGFGLTYGRLVRISTYVGVSGSYEHAYNGGKPTQVCEPLPDSNQTICKTIARTAPTDSHNEIATLEARQTLGRIAFNPRISYAFKDNKGYAAELLAYLFTSEKNGLNGGIHASYVEKKGRALAVFIGMPFQLFGD